MNKGLRFTAFAKFSLYTKIPKKYKLEKTKSWLDRLFSQSENSPTYILLNQLFDYLQNTDMFKNQFPYLQNTERMCQNNMIVHICLLKNRIAAQSELPRSQLQKFNYNLQNTFFLEYAAYANSHIPISNFKEHYSEAYMKKFQFFNQQIKDYEFSLSSGRIISSAQYAPLFRKLVYENRLNFDNNELIKFCKYFYAHKRYLNRLAWQDLLQFKVKWGFEGGKLIGQASEDPPKK